MPVRSRLPLMVRTYEVDALNSVPPAVFLQWMQDAALLASSENGYPPPRYRELGTAWVLGEMLLEIHDHPHPTENLVVETWAADFGAANAHRQYRVMDGDGKVYAAADALWVYVNIETRRPRRFDQDIVNAFMTDPERAPDDPGWGADLLKTPVETLDERIHTVEWSELDGAFHVNNAVYAKWVCDHLAVTTLGPPQLADKGTEKMDAYGPGNIHKLRLRYRRGARLGETVTWKLARPDDTGALHEISDAEGREIARAAVLLR